jgi:hypothetical protein
MQEAPPVAVPVTTDVLRNLFFSEDKPKALKPVDVSILAYLVLRRTEDHEIFDSFLTIAQRVCSDRQTVARSLQRLEKLKWISVGGRGRGRTKGISINVEELPAAQPVRAKITQEAKVLAFRYEKALQKHFSRHRFPKNWLIRQVPSAQRILTNCGQDLTLAARMVSHALSTPPYKARAARSLYHLLTVWPGIKRTYQEKVKDIQAATELPPQKGDETNEQCNAAA